MGVRELLQRPKGQHDKPWEVLALLRQRLLQCCCSAPPSRLC